MKEFGKSFVDAGQVLLTPIYAAREEFDSSISSGVLAEEINKKKEDGWDCVWFGFSNGHAVIYFKKPKDSDEATL